MRKLVELNIALTMARAAGEDRGAPYYNSVEEANAWAAVDRLLAELTEDMKAIERDAANWRLLIGEEQR